MVLYMKYKKVYSLWRLLCVINDIEFSSQGMSWDWRTSWSLQIVDLNDRLIYHP